MICWIGVSIDSLLNKFSPLTIQHTLLGYGISFFSCVFISLLPLWYLRKRLDINKEKETWIIDFLKTKNSSIEFLSGGMEEMIIIIIIILISIFISKKQSIDSQYFLHYHAARCYLRNTSLHKAICLLQFFSTL